MLASMFLGALAAAPGSGPFAEPMRTERAQFPKKASSPEKLTFATDGWCRRTYDACPVWTLHPDGTFEVVRARRGKSSRVDKGRIDARLAAKAFDFLGSDAAQAHFDAVPEGPGETHENGFAHILDVQFRKQTVRIDSRVQAWRSAAAPSSPANLALGAMTQLTPPWDWRALKTVGISWVDGCRYEAAHPTLRQVDALYNRAGIASAAGDACPVVAMSAPNRERGRDGTVWDVRTGESLGKIDPALGPAFFEAVRQPGLQELVEGSVAACPECADAPRWVVVFDYGLEIVELDPVSTKALDAGQAPMKELRALLEAVLPFAVSPE